MKTVVNRRVIFIFN